LRLNRRQDLRALRNSLELRHLPTFRGRGMIGLTPNHPPPPFPVSEEDSNPSAPSLSPGRRVPKPKYHLAGLEVSRPASDPHGAPYARLGLTPRRFGSRWPVRGRSAPHPVLDHPERSRDVARGTGHRRSALMRLTRSRGETSPTSACRQRPKRCSPPGVARWAAGAEVVIWSKTRPSGWESNPVARDDAETIHQTAASVYGFKAD
jgi:hypothetical protein